MYSSFENPAEGHVFTREDGTTTWVMETLTTDVHGRKRYGFLVSFNAATPEVALCKAINHGKLWGYKPIGIPRGYGCGYPDGYLIGDYVPNEY